MDGIYCITQNMCDMVVSLERDSICNIFVLVEPKTLINLLWKSSCIGKFEHWYLHYSYEMDIITLVWHSGKKFLKQSICNWNKKHHFPVHYGYCRYYKRNKPKQTKTEKKQD